MSLIPPRNPSEKAIPSTSVLQQCKRKSTSITPLQTSTPLTVACHHTGEDCCNRDEPSDASQVEPASTVSPRHTCDDAPGIVPSITPAPMTTTTPTEEDGATGTVGVESTEAVPVAEFHVDPLGTLRVLTLVDRRDQRKTRLDHPRTLDYWVLQHNLQLLMYPKSGARGTAIHSLLRRKKFSTYQATCDNVEDEELTMAEWTALQAIAQPEKKAGPPTCISLVRARDAVAALKEHRTNSEGHAIARALQEWIDAQLPPGAVRGPHSPRHEAQLDVVSAGLPGGHLQNYQHREQGTGNIDFATR